MKMDRAHKLVVVALLAAGISVPAHAQTGAAKASAATATPAGGVAPCPAYIKVEGKQAKVVLTGMQGGKVQFTLGDSAIGERREIEIEKVETTYFEYRLDWGALNKAVFERNWAGAAMLMVPVLNPVLEYLAIPDNNAVDEVLDMGNYMYKSAVALLDAAQTEEQKEKARDQLKATFLVFTKLGKASWSSVGLVARIKSYKVLVNLDKPKTARKYMEPLTPPNPGDRAYGLYWLLMGELDFADGQYRDAMQGAVNSLCFETKDVDTFPDALLLSAQCYEEMQEWYRARDVYYEIAKIFPFTDWSETAVRRLRFIMNGGLTREKEKVEVETVFFGLNEDMNKNVQTLFDDLASGKRMVFAQEEETGSKQQPAAEEEDKLNLDEPDQ
jgi:tetratricopeptide (TPR) repeat protein